MTSLDLARIESGLDATTRSLLTDLEVFDTIGSTNTYLAGAPAPPPGKLRVAIADEQTAGRGRHNREWVSERGSGLYESLAYTVAAPRSDLSALPLELGVVVLNALASVGIDDVMLKWPNDLVANDAKLGGLLAETRVRGEEVLVVAGIGINVTLPASTRRLASSSWANGAIALADIAATVPGRNDLAAAVTNSVACVFGEFVTNGLTAFIDRWRDVDWLRGRSVRVESAAHALEGVATGIDAGGALLLRTASGTLPVTAGTVTVLGGTL